MTLCVSDVRAWSVQHSVCHKKYPRDACVYVVDLWLHDQPFGFWHPAGTLQQKKQKKAHFLSVSFLFGIESS